MALLAQFVSKPLLVVAQTQLELDAWGRIALYSTEYLGKLGYCMVLSASQQVDFQVSSDLVSSQPVGDYSGEDTLSFSRQGYVLHCVNLCFFTGKL